jgi:hypothetical protein
MGWVVAGIQVQTPSEIRFQGDHDPYSGRMSTHLSFGPAPCAFFPFIVDLLKNISYILPEIKGLSNTSQVTL